MNYCDALVTNKTTIVWSVTAVRWASEQAGGGHETQGHFSSSRDYLKLMDTPQALASLSYTIRLIQVEPVLGGSGWLYRTCCFSFFQSFFLSNNPSIPPCRILFQSLFDLQRLGDLRQLLQLQTLPTPPGENVTSVPLSDLLPAGRLTGTARWAATLTSASISNSVAARQILFQFSPCQYS